MSLKWLSSVSLTCRLHEAFVCSVEGVKMDAYRLFGIQETVAYDPVWLVDVY